MLRATPPKVCETVPGAEEPRSNRPAGGIGIAAAAAAAQGRRGSADDVGNPAAHRYDAGASRCGGGRGGR